MAKEENEAISHEIEPDDSAEVEYLKQVIKLRDSNILNLQTIIQPLIAENTSLLAEKKKLISELENDRNKDAWWLRCYAGSIAQAKIEYCGEFTAEVVVAGAVTLLNAVRNKEKEIKDTLCQSAT